MHTQTICDNLCHGTLERCVFDQKKKKERYKKEGERPPQITSWLWTRVTTIMMIFSNVLVTPPLSWLCLGPRKRAQWFLADSASTRNH